MPATRPTPPMKVYHYPACSTCKDALKYLHTRGISFTPIHIVDTPPTIQELRQVLAQIKTEGGSLKNLFNTSGVVYKELKLAEKFPTLSEGEALKLLAENGKLIKRPFVVGEKFLATGFKESDWAEQLV